MEYSIILNISLIIVIILYATSLRTKIYKNGIILSVIIDNSNINRRYYFVIQYDDTEVEKVQVKANVFQNFTEGDNFAVLK